MKLCIQTGDVVDRLGLEKGYAVLKEAGFEAIDWNLDHAWKTSDYREGTVYGKCIFEKPLNEVIEHYAYELELIKSNNLTVSQAHAPFPAYIRSNPSFIDFAIEVFKRNIEYCDYIGCKNLVIHGISYSFDDDINAREDIDALNMKLYSSLIPVLRKTDVTVCLENLFTTHGGVRYQGHCGTAEQAVKIIDALNEKAGKECFGLCLDTGHLNLLHHDTAVYLPALGRRIKCLHIHDNNGSGDQHMAPLTGTVDWGRFCAVLASTGYDGDLSFETFNQTNIAISFDERAALPWLRLIRETGEIMRSRITG